MTEVAGRCQEHGSGRGSAVRLYCRDGGHIYEETEAERAARRTWPTGGWTSRHRWARRSCGLTAVGGGVDRRDFEIIVDGYNELIPKAKAAGVEILVENHWGPTKYAENTVRLLEEVDGLGLLSIRTTGRRNAGKRLADVRPLRSSHPFQDNVPSTAWATIRRSICRKHLPSCERMATTGSGGSNRYQRM